MSFIVHISTALSLSPLSSLSCSFATSPTVVYFSLVLMGRGRTPPFVLFILCPPSLFLMIFHLISTLRDANILNTVNYVKQASLLSMLFILCIKISKWSSASPSHSLCPKHHKACTLCTAVNVEKVAEQVEMNFRRK